VVAGILLREDIAGNCRLYELIPNMLKIYLRPLV
jgi:hypothetical protein